MRCASGWLPGPDMEQHRRPDGTYDGVGVMADLSGLSRQTVQELAAQVKANQARLAACERHDFAPAASGARRRVCRNCGGEADTIAVSWYEDGLRHGRSG